MLLRAFSVAPGLMVTSEMTFKHSHNHQAVLGELHARGFNRDTCGASCAFTLGILSPLAGSVLTAWSWITGPIWHGIAIQRMGTVLLALTVPLLLVGAHCLDRSEKDRGHNAPTQNEGHGSGVRQ